MTNAQKIPFARALTRANQRAIADAAQLIGKSLPASVVSVSGSIVTVKFEITGPFTLPQVTMPLAGSEYVRLPIQPGCKGFVIAADARLGGMSGLGGGVADLSQPANLSALEFQPLGNDEWFEVDGDVLSLYGPNGVTLFDIGQNSFIYLTPNGVTIQGKNFTQLVYGSNSVTVNSSGVQIVGVLMINGEPYLQHKHSGVQTGGGDTGGVVP